MENPSAMQVHCPFCNGAQALNESANYTCDFCLQPFSIVQARNEESRLLDEIRGWLDKRIGSAATGGGVDASSRAYIFQQRVLPDLRREVDRALEVVGGYGQHQLVPVPVPAPLPAGRGTNPLVDSRQEILALKNLRARLQSEYVGSFAIGEEDRAAVQALDRRLSEVMGLSNVADAANRRDESGYASARRTLEIVLAAVDEALGAGGAPALLAFLAGLQSRYRALVELCTVCQEAVGANAVSGANLAERAESIAAALRQAAVAVEGSEYSPADAMPVVISTQGEALAVSFLARWLRTYDTLAAKSLHPFPRFIADLSSLVPGVKRDAESATELVEACAWVVRVVRGEVAVPTYEDHSWVDGWAEGARAKKSLGMFGAEERVTQLDRFLLPVWVADVGFSKSTGAVFKAGVEGKCVGLVEATAPTAAKVLFLHDGDSPMSQALQHPRILGRRALALPASTAKAAEQAIRQACQGRPDMLQAQVRLRGMAFLPAVYACFESKKGSRALAACAAGQLPVEPTVQAALASAAKVVSQFA